MAAPNQLQFIIGADDQASPVLAQIKQNIQSTVGVATRGNAETEYGMRKMRGTLQLLNNDMGLGMPRAVQTFLATLGPLQGILGAAFAPIAIVNMIEILAKVPDQIGRAIDWIYEYDKAIQKVNADWTINKKLIDTVLTQQAKMAELTRQGELIGLSPTAAAHKTAEQAAQAAADAQALAARAHANLARLEDLARQTTTVEVPQVFAPGAVGMGKVTQFTLEAQDAQKKLTQARADTVTADNALALAEKPGRCAGATEFAAARSRRFMDTRQ